MYKTKIGLEVHIELKTDSKMFCSCRTDFEATENTNICPICLGEAGTLPRFNKKVLTLAIKLGKALNCDINNKISFDRKHYFYKDLPKGYQTTQFYEPILKNGYLDIGKKIRIKDIHMEEDAGRVLKNGLVDYNRAGIPLLELVTMPDFQTADEVIKFLKMLKEILIFLDISDAKIQEGSMRVDVNISVSNNEFCSNRVEIKNVGSFKAIKNAILYEEGRQKTLLEEQGAIKEIEHTRRFDEDKNMTIFMRKKESFLDYKYMQDVDILSFVIDENFIKNIEKDINILPTEKRKLYLEKYNLTENEIDILLENPKYCIIFESLCNLTQNTREVINLICGEFLKIINKENIDIDNINVDSIAILINLFIDKKINRDTYKMVFYEILKNDIQPRKYIEDNALFLIQDKFVIEQAIQQVLDNNLKVIEDYKNGKDKALKFLLGLSVKALKNKADINLINDILSYKIKSYL